jgi:hypothetical protein
MRFYQPSENLSSFVLRRAMGDGGAREPRDEEQRSESEFHVDANKQEHAPLALGE